MRGLSEGGNQLMPTIEGCNTRMTFEGRLRDEKKNLEERLFNINAVLEKLEKAPEVASIIEALN